jgi:hypothetical protein
MSYDKRGSKSLKGFRTFRVDQSFTALAIEKFLHSLDCPRALTVWLLYESGEHEQLANLQIDPLNYNTVQSFRDAYNATKFLSKFKGLTLESDLDQVALNKFSEFENLCRQTNCRFRNLSADPLYKGSAVWLHNAIIRKIERILGDFDYDAFFSLPDWGPGASTLIKRRVASPAKKFQCETGVTRDLYSLFPIHLLEKIYPLWGAHLKEVGYPNFQIGNRVVTVPKDATTNRVIAIEPGINLWFQQSIGKMLRTRLLRCGIDLRKQGANQRASRLGSTTGRLATIDLSSASDSVSRSVVEALLPPQWFEILDICRSHFGTIDNKLVGWEKFSSMGNGFTFQLESLLFFAISFCCVEYMGEDTNHVYVYGDDIVIPTSCYQLLTEIMTFYGFRVNGKKSHFCSNFRESCGSHWFSGFDVKPIYLKDRLSSLQSVYRLANAVRRLSHFQYCSTVGCDIKFRPVFEFLVAKVPKALRLRIPEPLGDGGFISNFDESTPSRCRHYIEGYRVFNISDVSKTYEMDSVGYLLAELWRVSKRGVLDDASGSEATLKASWDKIGLNNRLGILDSEVIGRNSVLLHETRIKISTSVVQQWYDLGPWV